MHIILFHVGREPSLNREWLILIGSLAGPAIGECDIPLLNLDISVVKNKLGFYSRQCIHICNTILKFLIF